MISFFEHMNIELLEKLYFILLSYRDLFHLSDDIFIGIKGVLDKKHIEKPTSENIIIHPTINDLFENNLYKIVRNGKTFLVPLWHHELLYDNSGSELHIKCFPILPEEITIDENNNIEKTITWSINDIWDKTNIFIYIGNHTFYILREQLMLREYQTIRLYQHGISRINTKDVYDITKKSDIILHIRLVV
jgi:hypothetical protein